MKIEIVKLLEDNYGYLIIDDKADPKVCAAVDPVTPSAVVAAAKAAGAEIVAVLTTHNHWDHAGGNKEMAKLYPTIPIYGGKGDDAEAVTKELAHGDKVSIGSITVSTLWTPCHTKGHVLYVADAGDDSKKAVFTGDTLFIAGCGRFNSGTPKQMHEALNTHIASLPDDTLVYVGHEYTASNLKFAASVEPDNADIKAKTEWCEKTRAAGEPTVPSTVLSEKMCNPFMRVSDAKVAAYVGVESGDQVEIMKRLREAKNKFGLGASAGTKK